MCNSLELFGVPRKHSSYFCILRILWLRSTEQRLQRQESSLDGKDGRPGSGESIETDGALKAQNCPRGLSRRNGSGTYCLAANIRVPDFGVKSHDRRLERIVIGYSDINRIRAALVRRLRGAFECTL